MKKTVLEELKNEIDLLKNESQNRQDKHTKPFNWRREGFIEGLCKTMEIISKFSEKEQNQRQYDFLRGVEFGKHEQVKKEGYAGVLPNGNIVDRREYPEALPMQQNSMLGIPKPNKI